MKPTDDGSIKYKKSYQPTLIESLLIAVCIINEKKQFKRKINYRNELDKLLKEDYFQDLLGKNTMNLENIAVRIDKIIRIFGE